MKTVQRIISRGKGFTLVELLVVVALLGVMAAVAVPNVIKYIGASDRTGALEEQHSVSVAVSAALSYSAVTPRELSTLYTDMIVPSNTSSTDDNDVAKYLNNSTKFRWTISITGVLSPGTDNPLSP